MKRFLWAMAAVLVTVVAALAGDAPAERADVIALAKSVLSTNWPLLLGWLVSEIMPFLPGKSNGILHLFKVWLDSKRQTGHVRVSAFPLVLVFASALLWSLLLIGGCTTLNISMNTTAGDDNKPAVKTDAEANQTISPNTSATIPLR